MEVEKTWDIFRSRKTGAPLSGNPEIREIILGRKSGLAVERSLESENIKLGNPLAYIAGKASFGGLVLHCSTATLIPTEYTTLLVDVALDFIRKRQRPERYHTVAEIGTGCGNVSVLLAKKAKEGVRIIASDISPEAVKVALKNVNKYRLNHCIRLVCGDLFEPFMELGYEGKIDFIICNPPYIPTTSLKKLPAEISSHQPRLALDGGPYGVSFFRDL